MKQSALTITIAILLWGCSNKQKEQSTKYTDYNLGNYLYNEGDLDSAFQVYTRYVNTTSDTLQKGEVYRYMGEMLWQIGDLYGAEENMTGAIYTLDSLNEKHHFQLGYSYNALGNINLDLRQYDSAINYYDKAISISRETGLILEVMNGKATALQKMRRYNEAIRLYDSILLSADNRELLARIIDNRAYTKWLQEPAYHALPGLWYALKIRTDSLYNLGLNASYAHLSDYYAKSKLDSALWYAHKMLEKAKQNNNPSDILEAMDKLIRLNNASDLKEYWYVSFKKLNDSLQLSRDTTRSRFAMIRYNYQKSKADNLLLRDQNRNQRLWMYGLIALAVLTISGISLWYAKRRKRLREEAENSIREARLKTSQKVHDVVANGLYRIMNELEHGKTIDKEPLINKIDDLYEKSRDISYEENASRDDEAYNKQVQLLLSAFGNKQTYVYIAGNDESFWSRVTSSQKRELELVLNEIMVNMKKHSRAKHVTVQFKYEDDQAFITYSDDGTGFNTDQQLGNGLRNTVNRIKSLNGNITFGKSGKGGALISINFPLQPEKT